MGLIILNITLIGKVVLSLIFTGENGWGSWQHYFWVDIDKWYRIVSKLSKTGSSQYLKYTLLVVTDSAKGTR